MDEAKELARLVMDTIYNYGKAKICNILEASMEGTKLEASKRLVEDVLDKIGYEINVTIRETLISE